MTDGSVPVKAVLLDIEGTTTSIMFVKDVLFPYARKHVEDYLRNHWNEEDTVAIINELRKQSLEDVQNGVQGATAVAEYISPFNDTSLKSVLDNIYWQMDLDRKTTGLKKLQGNIWKFGYDQGELKGHIYEDVPVAFRRWTTAGLKLFIYSSGSVPAQKLLFGQSEAGDLCQYLSGYFDTTTGLKHEVESYEKISQVLDISPSNILFCTDVIAEARAASKAGMQVRVLLRPGNKPLEQSELDEFQTARTMDQVL